MLNEHELIDNEKRTRLWRGFEFNGHQYQDNAAGFALLKAEALGELLSNGDKQFIWITVTNEIVKLNPLEAAALCEFCYDWRSKIFINARRLKNMPTLPDDYTNDKHWI